MRKLTATVANLIAWNLFHFVQISVIIPFHVWAFVPLSAKMYHFRFLKKAQRYVLLNIKFPYSFCLEIMYICGMDNFGTFLISLGLDCLYKLTNILPKINLIWRVSDQMCQMHTPTTDLPISFVCSMTTIVWELYKTFTQSCKTPELEDSLRHWDIMWSVRQMFAAPLGTAVVI